jgi:hypothetical protein
MLFPVVCFLSNDVACRMLCECKPCNERLMSLNEWERHTGSRKKNWKMSIRLKSTREPLVNLVSLDFINFEFVAETN